MLRVRSFHAVLIGFLFASTCPAEEWAQFRGPNAAGVYHGDKALPTKFSHKGENLVWSVDFGKGIACPVVSQA